MSRVTKISKGDKEIHIIDYSDCKEAEMIAAVSELKNQIMQGGKSVLILGIFNDGCYLTPNFMRHAEQATSEAFHLIGKQAYVGMSDTKRMILKGYSFQFKKDLPVFDTREEAIEFLLDDKTTNKSNLWGRVNE